MRMKQQEKQWIEKVIDGVEPCTPDFLAMLEQSSEAQQYYERQKHLVALLDRTPVPEAPDAMTDDIMAFIHKQETIEANTRSHQRASLLQGVWNALLDYIPDYQLPTAVRREAWAVAFSVVAILWGTWLGPSLQSGSARDLLDPIRANVVSFADELHEQSRQLPERFRSMTDTLIESATSSFGMGQSDRDDDSESVRSDQPRFVSWAHNLPASGPGEGAAS